MVVFGSSSWLTDRELTGEYGADRVALFTSCVTWLRDRSGAVGKSPDEENKKRQLYTPNVTPDNQWWLYRLPLVLMVAGVAVVGAGVWVVRRR